MAQCSLCNISLIASAKGDFFCKWMQNKTQVCLFQVFKFLAGTYANAHETMSNENARCGSSRTHSQKGIINGAQWSSIAGSKLWFISQTLNNIKKPVEVTVRPEAMRAVGEWSARLNGALLCLLSRYARLQLPSHQLFWGDSRGGMRQVSTSGRTLPGVAWEPRGFDHIHGSSKDVYVVTVVTIVWLQMKG